jgi:hypothetical protein
MDAIDDLLQHAIELKDGQKHLGELRGYEKPVTEGRAEIRDLEAELKFLERVYGIKARRVDQVLKGAKVPLIPDHADVAEARARIRSIA